MAKIGLIFTTDYEIFGNGTGCVENCVLRPAEKMAQILENHGAKLTVFLDVCEFWAFQKEFQKGNLKEDWAGKMQNQLQDFVKRGHDVQLHFHPQWIDYQYDENSWNLNYDLWRTGKLSFEKLDSLFKKGKETLEKMLQPVDEKYRCNVFRAGAWSIQPEKEVLKAMIYNGFRADSTVAAGLKFDDNLTFYDFKNAPEKSDWRISENVNQENPDGKLKEFPIFTADISFYKKLKFLLEKRRNALKMKPEGCDGFALASVKKSKLQKVADYFGEKKGMFRFGDATPCSEMIYFARKAIDKYKNDPRESVPVVAISHPKTFAVEGELQKFMEWAVHNEDVRFSLYKDFI